MHLIYIYMKKDELNNQYNKNKIKSSIKRETNINKTNI